MVTFTKTANSVEMDLGTDVHYLPTSMVVSAKVSSGKIFLAESPSPTTTFIAFLPTDINGRPSDDILAVAEWLRDTYFTGLSLSGGGGGGDATAANQVTEIALLGAIETDIELLSDKTPSDLVTEVHDYKQIAYTIDGDIDYVAYKTGGSGGTEVARITLAYDVNGNITGITKT